jgi:hypothetical protein
MFVIAISRSRAAQQKVGPSDWLTFLWTSKEMNIKK